jgi:hypothetical protein
MLCSVGRIHDNGRWGRFTTPFAFSKLGFDEEEEDITEDKNGASEIELFISEENDTKMALEKNRTINKLISNKSYTPPSTLEKAKGVVKRYFFLIRHV